MAREYGVLVIGAGWVSTQHIAAYANNPHTRIKAICDINLQNARKRAEEAGLSDVAVYDNANDALKHDGIDAVSICTPQQVHCENAIAAAEAGKHMIIEKPMAQSIEEMRNMKAAIDTAGVKTVVGFVLRWNPMFQALKKLTAEGAFGEIYCVETDYQSYCGDWWGGYHQGRTKEMGGSAMLIAGCHAADALRWFAAQGEFEAAAPVEVFAYEGGKRGQSRDQYNPIENTWHDSDPLEFAGIEMLLVKFSNGVLGKVSANMECIHPYRFPVEIFGNKGSAKDNKIWSHKHPEQKDWIELDVIRPDSSDVTHHPFQGEIDHFVECVSNDVESHCSFNDAVMTHEIFFAARECYKTGQPVKLPLG